MAIARVTRRRGAFGLDERRWPDPARVEAELRAFLALRLPEVWPLPGVAEPAGCEAEAEGEAGGRTLALLLPQGHVAVLRIARDRDDPGRAARVLAERCRAMRIPYATVSSLAEGRAALRRLGIAPWPVPPGPDLAAVFGGR